MIKRIALLFLALIVSGVPAFLIAVGLSSTGFLGSCFEGACAYAAVFYAFPPLWVLLLAAVISGWKIWRRRAAP